MEYCSVSGCYLVPVAKSYCSTHYKRWKRHGDATRGRPKDWGLKEKHPLYQSYMWFKRNNRICKKWLNFWAFVEGVGKRPVGHRLCRTNDSKQLSPTNFYWRKSKSNANNAQYQRQWRIDNPNKTRNNELKRSFGLTLDDYNKLLKKQKRVCAICKQKDPYFTNLAVDHCHKTNKVRGLLCHLCNRALGLFKEDIKALKCAIKYLNY